MAKLSPESTLAATAGALLGWLVALLGTFQIAYMSNLRFFLKQDLAIAVAALVGFSATLLFILSRSQLSIANRFVLAAAGLASFVFLVFWGSLFVACANGNCL